MAQLEDVPVALRGLLDALDGEAHPLVDPYAEAVLEVARSAAGGRPTPQARMAASGLQATAGAIVGGGMVQGSGGRSVPLSEIIAGAEWGSDTYHQFAGRNARGYWLFPSFEAEAAISEGERALEEIVRKVIP